MKSRYLYTTAIALIAYSWVSLFVNNYVKGLANKALGARRYQQVLYGAHIPISRGTVSSKGMDQPNLRWHLVLAFTETCPFCRRNRVNWERLLTDSAWPRDADVWLIPLGGGLGSYRDLPRLAKQHSVPLRVLNVRDRRVFTVETGLVAVPATTIVDRNERVRFVRIGEMAPGDPAAFMAVLNAKYWFESSAEIGNPVPVD